MYLPSSSETVYSTYYEPNISDSVLDSIFNFVTFWASGAPENNNMGGENTNIDAPIHIDILHDHSEGYGIISYFVAIIDCVVVNDLGLYTIQFGAKYNYDDGGGSGGDPFDPDYSLSVNLTGNIHEIDVKTIIDIKQFYTKNFYANVNGRLTDTNKSHTVISDIVENELGYTGAIVPPSYNPDWLYSFTVNKKINSKKLIEGIASASPYIPRFDNMGNFRFDYIANFLSVDDFTNMAQISAKDVIGYTYSRTKVEDVYTKVIVKYKWDYARDDFSKTTSPIYATLFNSPPPEEGGAIAGQFYDSANFIYTYVTEYYGLPEDHADSTLIVEDDRGKYIRDDDNTTAEKFRNWLLYWHANQHLKLKVKLPLHYLHLEVGSMITIDEVLGDVKPYGIDYYYKSAGNMATDSFMGLAGIGANINGQQAFPAFLITSTNKTLQYVEIECVQLHNLTEEILRDDTIVGCTNLDAWNYTEGANIEDGSCVTLDQFSQSNLCLFETYLTGDLAGEEDIVDWATNYVGDDVSLDDPNVFSSEHPNFENDAYDYWVANNYPSPGDANAPQIYSWNECTWQDTIYHYIKKLHVEYFNGTEWIRNPLGSLEDEGNGFNPPGYGWNLNISMDDEFKQAFEDAVAGGTGGAGFQIRVVFEFDITEMPNFAGDCRFEFEFRELDNIDYTNPDDMPLTGILYHESQTGEETPDVSEDQPESPDNTYILTSSPCSFDLIQLFDPLFINTSSDGWHQASYRWNMGLTFKLYIEQLATNEELQDYNEIVYPVENYVTIQFTGMPEGTVGDLNGDGQINILDVIILLNLILDPEVEYDPVADANGDGTLNILDIVTLIHIIISP